MLIEHHELIERLLFRMAEQRSTIIAGQIERPLPPPFRLLQETSLRLLTHCSTSFTIFTRHS